MSARQPRPAAAAVRLAPPGAWLWTYLLVTGVAFAAVAVYVALVAIPAVRTDAVVAWRHRLEASAEDRSATLSTWAAERVGDAELVAAHPAVRAAVAAAAARREAAPAETAAAERFLALVARAHGLRRVVVLVGDQALPVSTGVAEVTAACRALAATVARSGAPGIAIAEVAGAPVALFAVPVASGEGARPGTAHGVVLVQADLREWVFPFLRRAPDAEAGFESLLASGRGAGLRAFSPSRPATGSSLVRLPLDRLPAAAAQGEGAAFGRTVGEDGRPAWTAVRGVAGTDWVLVVSADERDVLAPVAPRVRRVAWGLTTLLAVSVLAGLTLWRGQRAASFRSLAEQEGEFRVLFESSPDAGMVVEAGVVIAANRRAGELLGGDDLAGRQVDEISAAVAGAGDATLARALGEALSGHAAAPRLVSLHPPRRPGVTVEVAAAPMHDRAGRAVVWLRDLSERRRAEEALAASEEKYRTILERLPVGTSSVRPDGSIEYVNPALTALLGYTTADVPDLATWLDLAFPDPEVRREAVRAVAAAGRRFAGGERFATTWPIATRSGAVRWVDFRVIDTGSRRVWTFSDVTTLRNAGEALRASEQKLRTLVRAIGEGVAIVDAEERFVLANPAAESLLGVAAGDLVGRSLAEFVAPDRFAAMQRATERRRAGESGTYEVPVRRADGRERAVVVTATPLVGADGEFAGTIGIFRDVTDERQRAEQALHGQKMEAIGRLAGGVAHDFNNLLQAMLNLTQLLGQRAGSPEDAAALAAELTDHVRRGAGLARQLLLFARRQPAAHHPVDLNDVVADTLALLSRLLPPQVATRVSLAPRRLMVDGDRGQLEQVFTNLVLNASDAMPEGGRLEIRTAACGDQVVAEVCDTGCGIPPEVMPRIFEPFFTTKGDERGTGLGLSVVDGIVRRHGGAATAESEVGRGSTFRVALPLLAESTPAPAVVPAGDAAPAAAPGGRVLVVEDEEELRRSLADVLALAGWQVEAVGSAEEAELLPPAPAFDVLLTDYLLPGRPGTALIGPLRARWPGLRAVLMSGYTPDEGVRRQIEDGTFEFLQKPFTLQDLGRTIGGAGRWA